VTTTEQGRGIVRLSWVGTGVFAVACVLGVVIEGFRSAFIATSLVLFAAGCLLFLWAYWRAVQRSRTDEVGIGGLYFLAGPTAPPRIKLLLNGSLAAQVVLAVATASLGIASTADAELNALAFAMLVPVLALGCTGLWGATHGTFSPRRRPTKRAPASREGPVGEPVDSEDSPEPHEIGQNAGHG
jgi:hypothetical protein